MTATLSVLTALTFFFMPAQTTLYAQDLSPTVELPAGYFVMLADDVAPVGYLSVAYDDITGYVKADEVTAVDYTPVTKYETTVRFACDNDGQPVNLRAKPERTAEILSVLPAETSGRCYGSVSGDALIAGGGTQWFYVNVGGTRGYLYYAHVKVSPTPPNIIEKEPEPEPPAQNVNAEPQEPKGMSRTVSIIFIIALCIPVPFIIFYLFTKPKDGQSE